jgi:ABC-type antimicrobial peptide transport system permease subunit
MINKDLGFKKEAIIYFDSPWRQSEDKVRTLKNELSSIPEITELSMSESPPSYNGWSSSTVKHQGKNGELSMTAFRKNCDSKFIDFYGIELIEGKNLSESDTVKEFLINETLLAALGFAQPEEAIGQEIEYGRKKFPIIGVVKDFHIQSLHKSVEPVIMSNALNDFACFNIKFANADDESGNFDNGIEKIEKAFKKIYPDSEFRYQFLDETLRNFYQSEQRASKLSNTATGLAIFISCLGLFGLVSYTTIQRTKEIGIRKVLGATVNNVVMLLSKDLVLLVAIAFVFAAPVAWYSVHYWLSDFAYRIEVNVFMFVATLVLAVAIAFLTVSWKTIGAARANPAESLRSE